MQKPLGTKAATPRLGTKLRTRADLPGWATAVRTRRKDLILTQRDLAELAGVAERTVIAIERGAGGVSLANVLNVLAVLGLGLSLSVGKGELKAADNDA